MEHVLFAVAIFIANIIQGLTGFAGSLLAMPPSINILGLIPAKVAVNTFGLVSSAILFVKNFRKMDWRQTGSETGSPEIPANRIHSADCLCVESCPVK